MKIYLLKIQKILIKMKIYIFYIIQMKEKRQFHSDMYYIKMIMRLIIFAIQGMVHQVDQF